MNYPVENYLKKVRGCFIGKSVGGTLGMPYEGDLRVNEVAYYNPVPTSMVANDDLDLQVIALELVRRRGLPVSARYLGELWEKNTSCFPDEYGVANNNNAIGLRAPLSGYYSSKFGGGMGAAIRSELWACLAPADPDLAVRLAREDAATDHYDDGVDACLFLTAVESCAFIESDALKLIEKGLSYIAGNRRMTAAFTDTIRWWNETKDMLKVRSLIIENYPSHNWTDVTINLSLIILAWLAGEGDFSRCICAAASMGYDADCTCATLGAILGLIDIDAIEEKWTWPIGDELVLSSNIVGMHEAATIGDFCSQIFETCVEIQKFYGSACMLEGDVPTYTGAPAWSAFPWIAALTADDPHTLSIVEIQPLVVKLVYPEKVAVMTGERTKFTLELANPMRRAAQGEFTLRVPDGFVVEGGSSFELAPGAKAVYEVYVTLPERPRKRACSAHHLAGGRRARRHAGLHLQFRSRRAQVRGRVQAVHTSGQRPRCGTGHPSAARCPGRRGVHRPRRQAVRACHASLQGYGDDGPRRRLEAHRNRCARGRQPARRVHVQHRHPVRLAVADYA